MLRLIKQSTQTRLPCILISTDDYESPMTGALYNDSGLHVKYAKEGDSAFTTKTLGSSDWIEIGDGVYDIVFSASELDTPGLFKYVVEYTTTGLEKALNYYGAVQIVDDMWGTDTDVQAIRAKTDNLPADPASQSQVETKIDQAESNIRGADSDTLKTLSDQLDTVQADLDNPDQYKADVSALALESTAQAIKSQTDKLQFDASNNIQSRVNNKGVLNDPSVSDIDSTLTASHGSGSWQTGSPSDIADAVWDELTSGHSVAGSFGEEVQSHATPSEVKAQADQALVDYDPPTKAELDQAESNIRGADNDTLKTLSDQLDAVQADLDNPDQYKADVSALALEANVETHVTDALNAYDPPTRAEATSDKNEILAQVQSSESNIRGTDSDDLKTLSDQIDGVQADLDNPAQYKADVSGLALETTVQAIKSKTDNLTFSGTNVQARVNDKGVLNDPSASDIDTTLSASHGPGSWESGGDVSAIANAVWSHDDALFLLKVIRNKKVLSKNGSVWELIIYDNDGTTPILRKELKDKNGNNINDLEAGILAQEIASSV